MGIVTAPAYDGFSSASASLPWVDVPALRRHHARVFVLLIRPIVVATIGLTMLLTELVDPTMLREVDYAALGVAGVMVVLSLLFIGIVDQLRIAVAAIVTDVALITAWILLSPVPEQTAPMLLWPTIALAYFVSPRAAFRLATVAAVGTLVGAHTLRSWNTQDVVPAATLIIFCSGVFISFVTKQGRRVEDALVASHARDRRVLALSRRIHVIEEPADAIVEIAREVGLGLGVDATMVCLDDTVRGGRREGAAWSRVAWTRTVSTDLGHHTQRALLQCRHAVIQDPTGTRLVPLDGASETPPLIVPAIRPELHGIREQLACGSCLVLPLPLGSDTMASIVVAGPTGTRWERDVLPVLEPLSLQLASGLAQVLLVRDQREALVSLQRVDRMRDRLIANVSHELRTPLTSTIGFIETLLRDDVELDDATRQDLMAYARNGGLRLLALVEDLLALGSIRPESLDLMQSPTHASELFATALTDVDVPRGRNLRVDLSEDPLLHVDRNRMLQVIGNLLNNAVRHGSGAIDLACRIVEDEACRHEVVLEVLDDGPGVDPDHVHELFLPFACFSSRTDSTGLGLAICRTIVEAHGGTIDYDRTLDGRTRFCVRMPVAAAASLAPEHEPITTRGDSARALTG